MAKDVARSLEYSELSNTARLFTHVPEEWAEVNRIHLRSENGVVQEREVLCLSEQGLYFFLARSDKPKALPFQKWLAGEVLPSLRKTGTYSMPGTKTKKGLSAQYFLDVDSLPDDVKRLKPRTRENCLNLAMQYCRLTGISDGEVIHSLFIDYCRAVGGGNIPITVKDEMIPFLQEYADTQLKISKGNRIQASVLYRHFRDWWKENSTLDVPSQYVFSQFMQTLCERRKVSSYYYLDIDFTETEDFEEESPDMAFVG